LVKPSTDDRIRELSREGKSSNEIIRTLRREHKGIRRTTALKRIREFKGHAPKKEPYKHIPKKYLTTERRIHIEHDIKQKHISVYGKMKGINKRFEVSGTGHELMDFLQDAVLDPPKRRIARVRAGRISDRKEIDYGKEWDKRPTITS
jgi:hypothetical protein